MNNMIDSYNTRTQNDLQFGTVLLLTQILEKEVLNVKLAMSEIAYQLHLNNPAQFIHLRRQSRYIYNHVSLILCDLWKITIFSQIYNVIYQILCSARCWPLF